jgi:hypothetical protein
MRPKHLFDHPDHRRVVLPVRGWVLGQFFGDSAVGLTRCLLEPGAGNLVRNVPPGHLGKIDRPSSGNDASPLIPPSPRGHPAAAGHIVSQLMESPCRLAIGQGGKREVSQRIGVVGVAPKLGHQNVGSELLHKRRNHLAERFEPGVIRRVRRQRNVYRRSLSLSLASFVDEAGAREEVLPGLMQ